jgi:hypothetical protein
MKFSCLSLSEKYSSIMENVCVEDQQIISRLLKDQYINQSKRIYSRVRVLSYSIVVDHTFFCSSNRNRANTYRNEKNQNLSR